LCCEAVRDLPVPVVARIHGYCFGGGLELAAACDVRIASEAATFGMQEVKIGIPSVIEAALLPQLVGWGRAREILLLGETFSAAEALAWRLVEHVVPASALDAAVEDWIGKLLTAAPRAVRRQKRLIRQWQDLPLSAAIAAGIDAFAAAYETDESVSTMRAFLAAKRRPGGAEN
jgi:enoyl-CoA hydratase